MAFLQLFDESSSCAVGLPTAFSVTPVWETAHLMGIKAFVFDCGGVVLRNGDLTPYQRWEDRLGLERGELALHLWDGEPWSLAERGRLTEDEFWTHVGQKLGLQEPEQIDTMRRDLWSTWRVDEQVLALIDRLCARYRIAMLSNATDALEEMLANRYRVADRFETIINSARLGIAKPEEAIYQETLRRLELEPGEIVFIDDRAENIAAAASAVHVIWFVHGNELERQLAVYLNHGDRGSISESDDGNGSNGKQDAVAPPREHDGDDPVPPH